MTSEYTAVGGIRLKSQAPNPKIQAPTLGFGHVGVWDLGFGTWDFFFRYRYDAPIRFNGWRGIMSGMHALVFLCLLRSPAHAAGAGARRLIAGRTRNSRRSRSASRRTSSKSTPFVSDAAGKPVTDLRAERLPAPRRRQAADGQRVLAREHPDRARGSSAVLADGHRAGRRHQRRHRRPGLSVRARRSARRSHARAAREGVAASVLRARTSAPTTSPPSSSRAAAPPTARTSRTTRGCCSRRSTSSSGASCDPRRSSGSTSTTGSRPAALRQAGDPVNDPVAMRARAATRAT